MDGSRFDRLTKSLRTTGSLRRALTALIGGTLGLLSSQQDEAAPKK